MASSSRGAASSSSPTVRVFDLQGWLSKEGGSIKTWKRRWCVLEKGTLYYFSSPDHVHGIEYPRAKGSLRVLGCNSGEESYKKKKNGFFVETDKRTYHFSAPTPEDRLVWLRTLQEAEVVEQPRIEAEQNLVSIKIALVGPSFVGKSSLIRCWADGAAFSTEYQESGVPDSSQKVAQLDGGMGCLMEIWEVPGSYSKLPEMVSKGLKAVLVAFDITRVISFSNAKKWVRTLQTTCPDLPLMIVGCKSDLKAQRQVGHEVAHTFAEEVGASYIEASAKSGTHVATVFEQTLEILYRNGVLYHRPILSS